MITNSINSALNGLNAFESKLNESAQNISNFPAIEFDDKTDDDSEQIEISQSNAHDLDPHYFAKNSFPDLAKDVVNVMIAKRGYEANLNVLKTADDMAKSVINILS